MSRFHQAYGVLVKYIKGGIWNTYLYTGDPVVRAYILAEILVEVIKKLSGHARIGVTATAYAHDRLRFQRDAIELHGNAFHNPAQPATRPNACGEPPLGTAPVR